MSGSRADNVIEGKMTRSVKNRLLNTGLTGLPRNQWILAAAESNVYSAAIQQLATGNTEVQLDGGLARPGERFLSLSIRAVDSH
jgi:hypothetical protein